MNVLILHQHFNTPQSGGALRSYFLAKAAVEKNWRVDVISGYTGTRYQVNEIEGIYVHSVPVQYSNYFGFWKRIWSFVGYVIWCIRLSGKFRGANICYAISTPLSVGWAARWIKWRYHIPYIFEVGDLWPDAPIELDVITSTTLKNILWRMEKKIYDNALSVVALSPAIQSAIEKKTPLVKVSMIPNMADTDFFKPEKKLVELVNKYNVEGKLVVSYFGAMGFANGLEYLLNAALQCQQIKLPIQFVLAGEGVERKNLERLAKNLELTNLTFHQFQNREGIRELMNITDIIFVCYRHATILETGSPNKFFDGLAAGKMIMINFGGWLREEIEKADCGVYVNPADPIDVVQQLTQILKTDMLTSCQINSKNLADIKYSRQALAHQWTAIINS